MTAPAVEVESALDGGKLTEIVEVPESETPLQVCITNASLQRLFVPIRDGALRLGPKESRSIPFVDVTQETRDLESAERIFIRSDN